jgi:HK97 family phage portal protein
VKQGMLTRLMQKAFPFLRPVGYSGSWRSIVSTEPFTGAWQRNLELDGRDCLMSNSTVYACTTRIANDVAKLPINLVEKQGAIWSVVERDSPFWRPLTKPNLVQNRIQFYVLWMLSKLMHGNTYALKERDGAGRVARLYVLPATKTTPMVAPDGSVFYRYTISQVPGLDDTAKEIIIPASEIIHDLMNPLFHPLCGIPPLFAAALSATQSRKEQNFAALFFENMAQPGGIVSYPGELKEEKAEEFKEKWEKKFSGANSGRVAFIGGGGKYEPMGYPAQQSQLIELLRWGVEDIARAFSMPLHKIGAGPVPTSNNVEALNQQYYDDCLQIHLESIELCLDEGLGLTNVQGQTLGTEFDLDNLLRMDSATQIESLVSAAGGPIYKIDEARLKRNLPPIEGGDTIYVQQQNWPIEQLAKRDPPTVGTNEAMPALQAPTEPKSPPGEPSGPDADAETKMLGDLIIAGFARERMVLKAHG